MVWGRGSTIFFCIWIFRCPSTICWRNCSFFYWIVLASLLTTKWLKVKAYFWALNSIPSINVFNLMLVPHCLDYCSFVVTFGIRKFESSNFVLFQDCFGQLYMPLLLLILMLASSKFSVILRKVLAIEQIVLSVSIYLDLLEETQLKKDQFLDKLNFLISFVLFLLNFFYILMLKGVILPITDLRYLREL